MMMMMVMTMVEMVVMVMTFSTKLAYSPCCPINPATADYVKKEVAALATKKPPTATAETTTAKNNPQLRKQPATAD